MKSDRKTKSELIAELESVRRKLKKLQTLQKKSKHTQLDITERLSAVQAGKQVEEAVRESEDKFKNVFENSSTGISITQLTGEIHVNRAFCDMIGFTKEEIQLTKWQAITHPDDIELTQREIDKLISRETEKVRFNKRYVHKNGTIVWVDLSSSIHRNSAGEPHYFITSLIDITERKQVEEMLRESEARYRSLLENSIMGISQALPDGRLLFANSACAKMYGYENPEEIIAAVSDIGTQLYANPEEREEVLDILKEKGVMEPREMTVKRRDGSRFFVLVSAREIRDSKGNLLYYQAEHVDITKRKLVEEALRKNEATLSVAMRIASLGTWEYDVARDQFTFNDQFYALFHTTAEREGGYVMSSMHYAQKFVHPEDMAMVGVEIQKALDTDDPNYHSRLDHRMLYANGEMGYITVNIRIEKDAQGRTVKTHGVNQDITERKREEEEISKSHEVLRLLANHLQNIREEERNHLAREFHDQIGQSMTALKMDLSLLLRMISDEKQDVSNKLVAEELHSMQKLVDETINLIWAIMTELRPQMLDDLGLLATFEWEAKQFESRTGISCEFKSSENEILLDPKKSIALFRIFQEALTNVARHANASVVKSVLRRENEMLVLEIKDNGCGIKLEKKSKPESFGIIGMRERALAIGGLLEISGIAGEGTTIIVRLPLGQVDEQESTSK